MNFKLVIISLLSLAVFGCDNAAKHEVKTSSSAEVITPEQIALKNNMASQTYIEGVHYEKVTEINVPAETKIVVT